MTPQQIEELKTALETKVAAGLISIQESHAALKGVVEPMITTINLIKSRLAVSLPGVDLGTKEDEKFSFVRAWYGIMTGTWKHAPFEKEVLDQATEKAGSAATGAAGGYVI